MSIAWFICPYKRLIGAQHPARYCALDDFTPDILADGGDWAETEVLGDVALVKVRASDATLTAINAAPGMLRIPNHVSLTDTLGDLSGTQRTAIRNKLNAMGYSLDEIAAVIPATGNWASITLGQVLRFAASRRLRPRYDSPSDTIVCDGVIQSCRTVESVSGAVQ